MKYHRLRIYEADDATIWREFSNDPAHPLPYLIVPDSGPEFEIDLLKGEASLGLVSLEVGDVALVQGDQDGGAFTDSLAIGGETAYVGRRAHWEQQDGVGGWITNIDGVCGAPNLNADGASYTVPLRNTLERARKAGAFDSAVERDALNNIVQGPVVLGGIRGTGGVFAGYAQSEDGAWLVPPAKPLQGRYNSASKLLKWEGFVRNKPKRWQIAGDEQIEACQGEAQYGDSGSFIDVRVKTAVVLWRANSGDSWKEINDIVVPRNSPNLLELGTISDDRGETTIIEGIRVDGTAPSLPANNQLVDFLVIYTGTPNKHYPRYLEASLAQLWKDGYDGKWGPAPRVRYNAARMTELIPNTPHVFMRVTEKVKDLREWMQRNLYKPWGWAPALNESGEIYPVSYEMPDASVPLITIDDTNTEEADWIHDDANPVNVIELEYILDRESPQFHNQAVPRGRGTLGGDGIQEDRHPLYWVHAGSLSLIGESREKYEQISIRDADYAHTGFSGGAFTGRGMLIGLARKTMAFDRYAYGAQRISALVRTSSLEAQSARLGSWATIGISWLPDYNTNRRGMNRLAQVIRMRKVDYIFSEVIFEDAGSMHAPVAIPTLGAISVDAAGIISVPVTSIPADGETRVDFAVVPVGDPAPDNQSGAWVFGGRVDAVSTVKLPAMNGPVDVIVRGRGEGERKRPSAYTAHQRITVVSAIGFLGFEAEYNDDGTVTVRWSVTPDTSGVRLRFVAHNEENPALTNIVDISAATGSHTFAENIVGTRQFAIEGEAWSDFPIAGTAGPVKPRQNIIVPGNRFPDPFGNVDAYLGPNRELMFSAHGNIAGLSLRWAASIGGMPVTPVSTVNMRELIAQNTGLVVPVDGTGFVAVWWYSDENGTGVQGERVSDRVDHEDTTVDPVSEVFIRDYNWNPDGNLPFSERALDATVQYGSGIASLVFNYSDYSDPLPDPDINGSFSVNVTAGPDSIVQRMMKSPPDDTDVQGWESDRPDVQLQVTAYDGPNGTGNVVNSDSIIAHQNAGVTPVKLGGTGVNLVPLGGLVVGSGINPVNAIVGTSAGQVARWDGGAFVASKPQWNDIEAKPSTFPHAAHASTHHTGGADPVTPAGIGAGALASANTWTALQTFPQGFSAPLTNVTLTGAASGGILYSEDGAAVTSLAGVNGQFLRVDVDGKPSWSSVDVLPSSPGVGYTLRSTAGGAEWALTAANYITALSADGGGLVVGVNAAGAAEISIDWTDFDDTYAGTVHSHPRGQIPSDVVYTDRLGASGSSTTTDWNDATLPGTTGTLLYGDNPNGPTGSPRWFHVSNLEYNSKDGTGNVTQIAIPYSNPGHITQGVFIRGRYNGSWSAWYEFAMPHRAHTWTALQTFPQGISSPLSNIELSGATPGGILYSEDGAAVTSLAGANGQFLRVDVDGKPSWSSVSVLPSSPGVGYTLRSTAGGSQWVATATNYVTSLSADGGGIVAGVDASGAGSVSLDWTELGNTLSIPASSVTPGTFPSGTYRFQSTVAMEADTWLYFGTGAARIMGYQDYGILLRTNGATSFLFGHSAGHMSYTHIVPSTTNAYDIGSPARQWADVHAYSGRFTRVFINSGQALYLDGSGDTYIRENLSDTIQFVTGDSTALQLNVSSENLTYRDFAPAGSYSSGTGARRWSGTYSVIGDFTGVLLAEMVQVGRGSYSSRGSLSVGNSVNPYISFHLTGTGERVGYFQFASSATRIRSHSATPMVFDVNDSEAMRIHGSTGNVSIGSQSNNGNRLQVYGDVWSSGTGQFGGGQRFAALVPSTGFEPVLQSVRTAGPSAVIVGSSASGKNHRAWLFVDPDSNLWGLGFTYSSINSDFVIRHASNENFRVGINGDITARSAVNAGTHVVTAANYGYGHMGLYDSFKYRNVYQMGAGYEMSADGSSLGSFYGIAMTYDRPSELPQSKPGLRHQFLFVENGVTQTAIGNGIWTKGVITGTNGLNISGGTSSLNGNTSITGTLNVSSFIDANELREQGVRAAKVMTGSSGPGATAAPHGTIWLEI